MNPASLPSRFPIPALPQAEEAITRRVEEACWVLKALTRFAHLTENVGRVTIELKDSVDDKEVKDDVEAAVERIADFPRERGTTR